MKSIDFPKHLIDEASSIASGKANTTLARALADISQAGFMRKQALCEMEKAKELRKRTEETLLEIERLKLQSALRYKRLLSEIDKLSKRPCKKDDLKEITTYPEAKELEDALKEIGPLAKRALNLETGVRVRVTGADTEGIISNISNNIAEVICGNKKIKLSIDQIECLSADTLKTPP